MTILDTGALTPRPAPPLPVIEASRVGLRPLRRSDAGPLALHCGDVRVARMTATIPHPYPPGAAETYVERVTRDAEPVWAIDGTRSGRSELLGLISIKEGHALGYWIAPPAWGQGFASEAVAALVTANPLNAARFTASVFADNPASARVLRKCGFAEEEGTFRGYSVARAAGVPERRFHREA